MNVAHDVFGTLFNVIQWYLRVLKEMIDVLRGLPHGRECVRSSSRNMPIDQIRKAQPTSIGRHLIGYHHKSSNSTERLDR